MHYGWMLTVDIPQIYTMSNTLFTAVPLFDGKDYINWSESMLSYLEALGIGYVIEDPRPGSHVTSITTTEDGGQEESTTIAPGTEEDRRKWDRDNSQARGNIFLRLTPAIKSKVKDLLTAAAIIDKLKELYGEPGVATIFSYFKQALNVQIPSKGN